MTLFGTSIRGIDIGPTFDQLNPQMVRVFDDTYKLSSVSKKGTPVAFSMMSWDDTKVATFLKTAVDGSVLIVKHEPEDDIDAGTLTLDLWRGWQLKLAAAIAKSNRVGKVFPAIVLMGWTADPHSKRRLSDYFTPEIVTAFKAVPGAIAGFDAYCGPNQGLTGAPTCTPEDVYGLEANAAKSIGLRLGIFETGFHVVTDAGADLQAAWWPGAFDFARKNNAYCFLLWNSTVDDTVGYQIWNHPTLVKTWRDAMATSSGSTPATTPPVPITYTQDQLDAAVKTAVDAAVSAQKQADDVALQAAVTTALAQQKTADDQALQDAVAVQKQAAERDLAAAVAAQLTADQAALAAAVSAQKQADDAGHVAAVATLKANADKAALGTERTVTAALEALRKALKS